MIDLTDELVRSKLANEIVGAIQPLQVISLIAPQVVEALQPTANVVLVMLMKAALSAYGEAQEAGLSDEHALELTKALLGIKLDLGNLAHNLPKA